MSAFNGQGSKRSDCNCEEKFLSVNEDIDLFSSGGECRNPTFREV